MAYNKYPQSILPGNSSFTSPIGDDEEPTWAMQPQIYPSGVVPSDEVLVKSLYKQLLKDKWELRYKPAHDDPEEYGLPSGLTGNSIWLQCKKAFFRAHGEIRESDVYIVERRSFLSWIEGRFNSGTVGRYGATRDLYFIVDKYVFWVDRAAAQPLVLDTPASMHSGYHGESFWSPGESGYCLESGGPSQEYESFLYKDSNVKERI
ncbi:hypothetical protein GGS24DRAFT_500850 [Hypoxylon argillaceum]|nr:hypothetical protein GGS24DRAFT_500850 [Hypoxylon argillaceum]